MHGDEVTTGNETTDIYLQKCLVLSVHGILMRVSRGWRSCGLCIYIMCMSVSQTWVNSAVISVTHDTDLAWFK